MNGSIRKRGKASWELTIDLGRDDEGKRLRKFVHVKGAKADAQRQLRELLTAHDKGLPLDNSKLTVGQFLERWLRDYAVPSTRPRTSERYAGLIRKHLSPVLGHIAIAKLQPADIQGLQARMLDSGLSPRTVQYAYRTLFSALKQAVRWGILFRNPAEAVDPPKAAHKETIVPAATGVRALLELAQQTPYHAVLHFIAYTGCRRGEALGIRWGDVDLQRGVASIVQTAQRIKGKGVVFQPPKSAKGRRAIALDVETTSVLNTHRARQLEQRLRLGEAYQDEGLVFAGPLGNALDPSVLTRTFEKLAKKAGLEGVRLHDLRHFHATLLLQAGTHPKVVQERLGHATISITLDTYSHVLPGLQEQAATAFAAAMGGKRAL